MKCILMNKNTEVLVAEYDAALDGFLTVYEVKHLDYAPLILGKESQEKDPERFKTVLSGWFRDRGIPRWRDKLDLLLARLGVGRPEELLDKSFGLSLSDQYWLKPFDSDLAYNDINFFDHDFDSADFLEASFSNSSQHKASAASLRTPNNTTDGMLRKAWIIEGQKRILLKGGFREDTLQPFNEVLASEICRRLGFRHIDYALGEVHGKIVSKCECYTTKDTEIIPAYQILAGSAHEDAYETYLKILEEHGITNAREELENMFMLDYLILNEDRHLNNFGIIRNVNTLEWIETMPIFDNGQSLGVTMLDDGAVAVEGVGRFFYDIKSFDEIIKTVREPGRFDFSRLDDLPDFFRELLIKYQGKSRLSDNRIAALVRILRDRIMKAKKLAS